MERLSAPLLLSKLESYQQFERALKRLRVKELICGPYFDFKSKRCCAKGVANIHAYTACRSELFMCFAPYNSRFVYDIGATIELIEANESFRGAEQCDNYDKQLRQARYKHVLKFVRRQIKALSK